MGKGKTIRLTHVKPKRYVAASFAKVTHENGQPITVVEFCSRSVPNLATAVFARQLASNTGLDALKLAKYQQMLNEWHAELIPKLKADFEEHREELLDFNPLEVIDSKPWTMSKRLKYARQIFRELEGSSNPNRFYFGCFVKSGE
jgi:hypothetical protein